MRREINILWVEDNMNTAVKDLQDEVTELIESALYDVNIFNSDIVQCIDFGKGVCEQCGEISDCNRNLLRDKRIDIIFSDNNLGESEGVDFLTEYRLKGEYKYYILYSNLDEKEIIAKIADRLNINKKVHLFSNFDFLSLNDWEERIDDAISAFLNNRSKMEELRNIYIVENSIIEDKLGGNGYNNMSYYDQIRNYCRDKGFNFDERGLWHRVRIDRNVLAHGNMTFNNGYNIASDGNKKVSESEFEDKLEKLKSLTELLISKDSNFFQ